MSYPSAFWIIFVGLLLLLFIIAIDGRDGPQGPRPA